MDEFGATGATGATGSIGAIGANPYIIGATMSATSNLHQLVVVGRCYVESTYSYNQLAHSS